MDASELNRKLNGAARFANLALVTVANGGSAVSKELTQRLIGVLAEVEALQRSLNQSNPDLEYHYDPDRAPTAFMRQIQELDREAQAALANGNRALAIQKLNEALALEPPALPYEVLEKRRDAISRSA